MQTINCFDRFNVSFKSPLISKYLSVIFFLNLRFLNLTFNVEAARELATGAYFVIGE